MAEYQVVLTQDNGTALALLTSFESLEYTKVVNGVGVCTVVLPWSFDKTFLAIDNRLEIWRKPDYGPDPIKNQPQLQLERVYFIRHLQATTDDNGVKRRVVTGVDTNSLLKARGVQYYAGAAEANKTDYCDDMMKAIVRENLGALAPAARDWTANGFTVQLDVGLGPSVTMVFANKNVLATLQDLAQVSKENGTDLYFDLLSPTATTYEFRTYIDQVGMDHTSTGVNPVIISEWAGTLAQPELDEDYTNEVTQVRVGGPGEGASRSYVAVEDTVRSGRSIWGRREGFQDARNTNGLSGATLVAAMTSEGNEKLTDGLPKRKFSGRLCSNPQLRYGIEWGWGDRVTAQDDDAEYDALIRVVKVKLDSDNHEDIDAQLEVLL